MCRKRGEECAPFYISALSMMSATPHASCSAPLAECVLLWDHWWRAVLRCTTAVFGETQCGNQEEMGYPLAIPW